AKNADSPPLAEWVPLFQGKVDRNLREAFKSAVFRSEKYVLFVVVGLVGFAGLRLRNMYCVAAAVFTFLAFANIVLLFHWEIRVLLFTVPGLAVALAVVCANYLSRPLEKQRPIVRYALAIAGVAILSAYAVVRVNDYRDSVPSKDAQ